MGSTVSGTCNTITSPCPYGSAGGRRGPCWPTCEIPLSCEVPSSVYKNFAAARSRGGPASRVCGYVRGQVVPEAPGGAESPRGLPGKTKFEGGYREAVGFSRGGRGGCQQSSQRRGLLWKHSRCCGTLRNGPGVLRESTQGRKGSLRSNSGGGTLQADRRCGLTVMVRSNSPEFFVAAVCKLIGTHGGRLPMLSQDQVTRYLSDSTPVLLLNMTV
jgi:hypothetical protein